MPMILQATTRQVMCHKQGVDIAAARRAQPGSRFTAAWEDTCAWLVCYVALPVVAGGLALSRCHRGPVDLPGSGRSTAWAVSYRRGQRHLTVLTSYDTGRLLKTSGLIPVLMRLHIDRYRSCICSTLLGVRCRLWSMLMPR